MKQKFKVTKEEVIRKFYKDFVYDNISEWYEIEGELVDPQCKPSGVSNCQPIVNQCKSEEGKPACCIPLFSHRHRLCDCFKPATPQKIEKLEVTVAPRGWRTEDGEMFKKINELVEGYDNLRDHLNQQERRPY